MNKIAELISRLCPDGVEFKTLDSLISYVQPGPYIVSSTEYDTHYSTPVLTAGQSFILGYTNEEEGIYNASPQKPVIIFDDFTTSFHWVDFDFKVKSSALKILKLKDKQEADFRYIYMAMKTIHFIPTNHMRHWISLYSKFEIPLPPLNIQKEIVSILDSFTSLIDKMKQEVEMRKKQMEYYIDKFYGGDFDGMMRLADIPGNSVVQFSDLGPIIRGKRFVRDDIRTEGQPCIHYGDMYTYYGTKAATAKTFLERDFPKKMRYAHKGDVVIVGAGENDYDIGVGLVWMGEEPAAVHDACYILKHHQIPMYISYYLRSNIYHQQLKKYVSSGKISSFSAEGLGKVYIPIQSEEKQRQIASILDTFETYISKLEQMIELRQKQYEYYREKLLTFE